MTTTDINSSMSITASLSNLKAYFAELEDDDLLIDGDNDLQEEGNLDNDLSENLDVPGADLDDADEEIGEEDEENNYYSIGGDDHNDLDEDNGQ